jgi:Transglutaminase-like superfamily
MLSKIRKIPRKIRTFFKIGLHEKAMFFEALVLLVFSEMLIRIFPFSYLKKNIVTTENYHQEADIIQVKNIAKAVSRACQIALWQPKCYAQALTAKIMLKRRHIEGELYLGVTKDPKGKMLAHAWTKSRDYFLTGQSGYEQYTVVATFS